MLHQLIDAAGEQVHFVHSGAAYRGVRARDVGNGLFVVDKPVTGLRIDDLRVDGAYRVIENAVPRGKRADCVGLRVSHASATGLRRGFARLRYGSHDGRFVDVTAQGVLTTGARDLPVGIALAGDAHDFVFERCTMRGFRWQRKADQYWNGDGYSAERGNRKLLFRRCAAWDNSDGGFDLKSTDTRLDDCVAGRNARNYRLWSSIAATRLTSIEPRKIGGIGDTNHFSLMASKAASAAPIVIEIAHLVVRSARAWPIFDVHDGPVRIVIGSHDIDVPKGTPLVRSRGGGSVPGGILFRTAPPRL